MRTRTTSRAAAVLAAVSLFVAACGGDDDVAEAPAPATEDSPTDGADTTDPDATDTEPGTGTGDRVDVDEEADAGDVDPDGVLRIGWDLVVQMNQLDPAAVGPQSPSTGPIFAVYGHLLKPSFDGPEPGLAESAEVVDPNTLQINLRDGVEFSDGTPFDADAVKFGIERNRDAENPVLSAELQLIESITVDSPVQLTLNLSEPVAGALFELLPYGDFAIVSPTAVADGVDLGTNPVGAGPFLFDSGDPESGYTFVKNENYIDADEIRLAGVEWVQLEFGPPTTNALLTGAIDVAEQLFFTQAAELEGSADLEVITQSSDTTILWGQICKNRPPFDDIRVRQAINYGIDREVMNQFIFDGNGEPMWGFHSADSPLASPETQGFYDYDPERARELLAEAGASDLTFTSFFQPGVGERGAEVLQSQLAEIGVTVDIRPLTSPGDFYPDASAGDMYWVQFDRSGIQKVARTLQPGSVGNPCNWDDPELNRLLAEAKAIEPGSPEAEELWHQIDRQALEEAANLFGMFGARAVAWNHVRIGGMDYRPAFNGRPAPDFFSAYIAQS